MLHWNKTSHQVENYYHQESHLNVDISQFQFLF